MTPVLLPNAYQGKPRFSFVSIKRFELVLPQLSGLRKEMVNLMVPGQSAAKKLKGVMTSCTQISLYEYSEIPLLEPVPPTDTHLEKTAFLCSYSLIWAGFPKSIQNIGRCYQAKMVIQKAKF